MVWRGRQTGKPVVDISRVAAVVHQTHDYRHHPEGRQGIYNGEEAELNVRLAGGRVNFRRISDATHVARAGRIGRSRKRYWMEMHRAASSVGRFVRYEMWNPVYFALLGVTRPVRNALGLRSSAARAAEKNDSQRPDRE
jgi:hypothetical protein